MSASSAAAIHRALSEEAAGVLVDNEVPFERLTVAALSGGHVILEGVPGIAKTTMAKLFANLTGLSYSRIQLLPDMLPSDVTGSIVYRESTGEFEQKTGPIFANVVVADEVNRATPKTQAAFLEAMAENTVTIDEETLPLPAPFIVIATQNPLEVQGTYELPIAQRDRFQQKLLLELPDRAAEAEIVDRFDRNPDLGPANVARVLDPKELLLARRRVAETYVDPKVVDYILDLVAATRGHEAVRFGASPRATLAFLNAGKAKAAIAERDYVIPDDVKALAPSVLRHRTLLSSDAEMGGRSVEDVIADVLEAVDPPGTDVEYEETADADDAAS